MVLNNIITGPISLVDDVYGLLEISPQNNQYDVAYACSNEHGKINIWSKFKPVRYDKVTALSDAEFKGTAEENAQGIYYGVKLVPSNVHFFQHLAETNYEYYAPVPGQNWCRLSDFYRYKHDASCSLHGGGLTDGSLYYNLPNSLTVDIWFEDSTSDLDSQYSIDFSEIVQSALNKDPNQCYPCVMIHDTKYNKYYVRALCNRIRSESSEITYPDGVYTALTDENGAIWSSFSVWNLNLMDMPNIRETTYNVTIFLATDIEAAAEGGTSQVDFISDWLDVTGAITTVNMIGIPGLVEVPIEFKYYSTVTNMNITGASLLIDQSNDGTLTFKYHFPDGNPTEATTYTIRIHMPYSSPTPTNTITFEWTYTPGALNLAPQIPYANLGIIVTGDSISLKGDVYQGSTFVSSWDLPDTPVTRLSL